MELTTADVTPPPHMHDHALATAITSTGELP